ncbi:MAG: hypothetical protein Q8Q42_00600 [Nanoarchaeota archaeon]|nr:hypothetical protein [Nanoarchaeota archaeon]
MKQKIITISKKEYCWLKKKSKVNEEIASDIVRGIHDILSGKVKMIK